jgi:transposase
MTKPLSLDLRRRIIRAVENEGMSRRAAAARFGVAPSTAVELVREWKETGSCEARPQGGDRRSARIEAHSAQILALVKAEPDITLAEIAGHLLKVHGDRFVPSVVWRFFDRRAITFKKNRARQRAGSAGRGRAARRLAGPSA